MARGRRAAVAGALFVAAPLLMSIGTSTPSTAAATWTSYAIPVPANDYSTTASSCPQVNQCALLETYFGSSPVVLFTQDGGASWLPSTPYSLPVISEVSSISCPTLVDCLVGGYNGVARTANEGASWTLTLSTLSDPFGPIVSLDCPTVEDCYALAQDDIVYVSSDGAQSWTKETAPLQELTGVSSDFFLQLACGSATACWFIGSDGTQLFGTTDGGETWVARQLPQTYGTGALSCPSALRCYLPGPDSDSSIVAAPFYSTQDGGATWTEHLLPQGLVGFGEAGDNGIDCPSALTCFLPDVSGPPLYESGVAVTTDGGVTWTVESLPGNTPIMSPSRVLNISCPNADWCGGAGKAALSGGEAPAFWTMSGTTPSSGLEVSVTVGDATLQNDPSLTADVLLHVTVSDSEGAPVGGATVTASAPSPYLIEGTTDASGQVVLAYPVALGGATTVTASRGDESKSTPEVAFNETVEGQCVFAGSPSQLNRLSGVLDYALPGGSSFDVVAGWLSFVSSIVGALPSKDTTIIVGDELTGSHLKTIYELVVSVNDARGDLLNQSTLYSHQSSLTQITTGISNGGPLTQIEVHFGCGPIA